MIGLGRRQLLFGAGAAAAAKLTAPTARPAHTAGTVHATLTADTVGPAQGWVNVKDYGAVGNAIHDDTAAINAAINAVAGSAPPATHTRFPTACVYLPPGAYKVTSDLLIQSVEGFVFAGAGSDLTLLVASGRGFTTAVFNIDGSAKGKYQGFTIVGDGTESSGNMGQTTIQGIQSQDSGQLLYATGGSIVTTVSVRDVVFVTSYLVSSDYWIEVTGIARGWEFSNVRAYSTTAARPVIFFSGAGYAEVATLINVAQRNTATAGVVVQSGGSVKLVNYMQLNAISEVTAVWHDFIVTRTSAYTCTQSDRYVLADAARAAYTVTLPSAALCPGKAYTVKKIDASAHAVTVTATARQTIDGARDYYLRHRHSAVELVSNGSDWFVTTKL